MLAVMVVDERHIDGKSQVSEGMRRVRIFGIPS